MWAPNSCVWKYELTTLTYAAKAVIFLFELFLTERKFVSCGPSVRNTLKSTAIVYIYNKGNFKSSMARCFPVENLLPQNVPSIIDYLQ